MRLGIVPRLLVAAVAVVGIAIACDDAGDDATPAAAVGSTPRAAATATAPAASTSTTTAAPPAPAATPASVLVRYACQGGKTFEARVFQAPAERAILNIEGRTIEMRQVPAASGIRYTDGAITYSSRGDDAFIEQGGQMTYRDCKGERAAAPPAAERTVTGTVTYLERIALPPNAVVSVQLVDVSRADAPAIVVALQTIDAAGKQVPFAFELPYDPSQIRANGTYAVQARVTVDNVLWFITDTAHLVITQSRPTQLAITMRRSGAPR